MQVLGEAERSLSMLPTAATEELQGEASVINRMVFQPLVVSQRGKEKAQYTNEYCTLRLGKAEILQIPK